MKQNEFVWGFESSVSGKHLHSVSRHSRKEKLTSCRVSVTDKTTGLTEKKEIQEGHYSKKEMQKLREKTILELMEILTKKRKENELC